RRGPSTLHSLLDSRLRGNERRICNPHERITPQNGRSNCEKGYSPLPPPPSCLSLANTASTSRSSDFLAGAAGPVGSSFGAVVTEAGRSVAPCASTGAGFSLAAR